jgi:hypothetical protein
LTLRTLLAYLDDTLEPGEIKTIGQKVAESDAAQELIARIKQVTRRRRLTTPPTSGPGSKLFDPNTIAEYLDNELSGEQIAEVEKVCLESDVHLAEIAACHQILTLVLGEPALVPPTAKERMYGLVKGREAIPFRKAPTHSTTSGSHLDDGEDALMPFGRLGTGWTVWAGALIGLCLLAVLVGALWSTVRVPATHVAANSGKNSPAELAPETTAVPAVPEKKEPAAKSTEITKPTEVAKSTEAGKSASESRSSTGEVKKASAPAEQTPPMPPAAGDAKPDVPSPDRRDLATYQVDPGRLPAPSILVTRRNGTGPWQRVEGGRRLVSADPLVSLPGCPSELRFDGGVRMQMWGTLPEFTVNEFLRWVMLESAVVLHAARGVDLDFTLDRGRVYLSNYKEKDPARIRLRFDKEAWDLTLQEPGTEVAIDFFKTYGADIDQLGGEEPRSELHLCVLSGRASLKTDAYHEYPNLTAPPGPALFHWSNRDPAGTARTPDRLDRPLPVWNKELPTTDQAKEKRLALDEISKRMTDRKPVDVALLEEVQVDQRSHHVLGILGLAAIDAVPALVDILSDETQNHGEDRLAALHALRRWVSRSADHSRRLYDPKTDTGVLIDKKYSPGESRIILELLREFTPDKWRQVETFQTLISYLRLPKIALRELGYWHLLHLSIDAEGRRVKTPAYNPADPPERRERAAQEFLQLVKDGKLPPPLPGRTPAAAPPAKK